MKLKKINLFALFIVLCLTTSCENDDNNNNNNECIEYDTAYVTSVNSPTTGMINEVINIEVSFRVFNGCGGFEKFNETENGNIRTIEVEAKYEGCICTQDAPLRNANYEFITSNTGDYELNFKSNPTEFITVNLTIN